MMNITVYNKYRLVVVSFLGFAPSLQLGHALFVRVPGKNRWSPNSPPCAAGRFGERLFLTVVRRREYCATFGGEIDGVRDVP